MSENLILGCNWEPDEWPDHVDVSHEGEADSKAYVTAHIDTGTRQSMGQAVQDWNRRAERTCRWEHIEGTLFVTECGETYGRVVPDNYCPHCGAKVVENV